MEGSLEMRARELVVSTVAACRFSDIRGLADVELRGTSGVVHLRWNRRTPDYACPSALTACFPSHLDLVVGEQVGRGQVFVLVGFVEVGEEGTVARDLVVVAVEDWPSNRCSCSI